MTATEVSGSSFIDEFARTPPYMQVAMRSHSTIPYYNTGDRAVFGSSEGSLKKMLNFTLTSVK